MKSPTFTLLLVLIFAIFFTLTIQSQDSDDVPILEINVAGERCRLAVVEIELEAEMTPEVAAEAPSMEMTEEAELSDETADEDEMPDETVDENMVDYPIITLDSDDEDCADVIPALFAAANGTIWIALSVPDEDEWQEFEAVSDDEFSPTFDRRGRFIGCANPNAGEQICSVLWVQDETTYRINLPILIGDVYIPPADRDSGGQTSNADQNSSESTGTWGECGSCSDCGANANVCITNPEGACVADPATCNPRDSDSGGGGGAPRPQSTEES